MATQGVPVYGSLHLLLPGMLPTLSTPLYSPLPSECLPLPSFLKISQLACPGLPSLCLPLYQHAPQGLVLTPFAPLPHPPGHPQEQGRSHFLCAQNIKTLKESWLVNSWGEQAVSHLPLLS